MLAKTGRPSLRPFSEGGVCGSETMFDIMAVAITECSFILRWYLEHRGDVLASASPSARKYKGPGRNSEAGIS
jgi:hypothetical protein